MTNPYIVRKLGSTLLLSVVIFCTYTCVFAYRKPFTVASFEGERIFGISYQTFLIISQVAGYMLSKFAGIRLISQLKRTGRWRATLLLVGVSWLALLLFALLPAWAGPLCFMVNGFALGFMWGVVFSYAEGRQATDFIGSVLAVSFIFAGGFTRSVGKWLLLDMGVTERWMPFMTGLVFAGPLVICYFILESIPAPDEKDKAERVERVAMTSEQRSIILSRYAWGIGGIALAYGLLTIMRDIRDNYMGNMWNELGYAGNISILTASETRISLVVLLCMSLLVWVRHNFKAFRLIHLMILVGFVISGVSSAMFLQHKLEGFRWMQLAGLGLYMAYIPFNAIYFERMIASFRLIGNVGFLIYIIDAFGYLGSVGVMVWKERMGMQVEWSHFFAQGVIGLAIVGVVATVFTWVYFAGKYRNQART